MGKVQPLPVAIPKQDHGRQSWTTSKRKRNVFLAIYITTFVVISLCATVPSSRWSEIFKYNGHGCGHPPSRLVKRDTVKYIEHLRKRYQIPGIALTVVHLPEKGVSVQSEGEKASSAFYGFGQADVDGRGVSSQSLVAIASNSKLFTAVAVGLLIENGTVLENGQTLDWETKVKDAIPGWQLMDQYASDHVNVVDLLSMQSGMPRHDLTNEFAVTPAEIIARMRYLRPSCELREHWQYNNQHYVALSHMVAVHSGMPFHEYVQKHILNPLDMSSTTYNATIAKETGHRVDGFARAGLNSTLCKEGYRGIHKPLPKSCVGQQKGFGWWTETDAINEAGPGGITTSGIDMAKWLKELLDPKVIPQYILDKVRTARAVVSGKLPHEELGVELYGLAQQAVSYRGLNVFFHGGSLPGQRSLQLHVPSRRFAMFIHANDDNMGYLILNTIAYRLLDDLLELEPVDWESRFLDSYFQPPASGAPSRPESPLPAPQEQDVVGQYTHKAYGSINFTKDDSSQSEYAAAYPRAFVAKIELNRFSGPVFNWTAIASYPVKPPTGASSTNEVVSIQQGGASVHVCPRGLGWFGDVWGQGPSVPTAKQADPDMPCEVVEEQAEVWFDKI